MIEVKHTTILLFQRINEKKKKIFKVSQKIWDSDTMVAFVSEFYAKLFLDCFSHVNLVAGQLMRTAVDPEL